MNTKKVNVEKMSETQLNKAIKSISERITKNVDQTCEKANKLLSKYGLKCKMQIIITEQEQDK